MAYVWFKANLPLNCRFGFFFIFFSHEKFELKRYIFIFLFIIFYAMVKRKVFTILYFTKDQFLPNEQIQYIYLSSILFLSILCIHSFTESSLTKKKINEKRIRISFFKTHLPLKLQIQKSSPREDKEDGNHLMI